MSDIAISPELLALAKTELEITWEDPDTDAKLTSQLQRGIAYITSKTGMEVSVFDNDDELGCRAKELLFNYVMYDRAGSVDTFKINYRPAINGLKDRWRVDNYEAATEG